MRSISAVGVSGSTSSTSRSRTLVARALEHLATLGVVHKTIDLLDLPADALLGRRKDPAVDAAIADVLGARILVVGTPVYRATYSGQLKAFFDLFMPDSLRHHAVALIATAQIDQHYLAIDHGLRPLIASLRGTSLASGVYVTNAQMPKADEVPPAVSEALLALGKELRGFAEVLRPAPQAT